MQGPVPASKQGETQTKGLQRSLAGQNRRGGTMPSQIRELLDDDNDDDDDATEKHAARNATGAGRTAHLMSWSGLTPGWPVGVTITWSCS